MFEGIGKAIHDLDFRSFFKPITEFVGKMGGGLLKGAFDFLASAIERIKAGDFSGLVNLFNTLIAGGIGLKIKEFVDSFSEAASGIGDIKDSFTKILDQFRGTLETYQTSLKADVLKKIAVAIAILVGSLVVLSFVDADAMGRAVGAITQWVLSPRLKNFHLSWQG